MADFILKLRAMVNDPWSVETVHGADDGDALDLAMIRLMATPDMRLIEVWDADRLVGRYVRDGG